MTMRERKTIQIMPADGWYAVYADPDEEGHYIWSKLCAWALVSDDDETTYMSGIDGEMGSYPDFAADAVNFDRYAFSLERVHESRDR